MELTHDDVQRILKIIDEADHVDELDLSYGSLRLHIRRHGAGGVQTNQEPASPPMVAAETATVAAAPATASATASKGTTAPAPPKDDETVGSALSEVPEGMTAVCAPMLGTFYRAPSPGEKPFVEVGQVVKAGDTVCIIEVMKLFSSVKADVDGKIAQILVENAQLVEFGQVMILIEPAG